MLNLIVGKGSNFRWVSMVLGTALLAGPAVQGQEPEQKPQSTEIQQIAKDVEELQRLYELTAFEYEQAQQRYGERHPQNLQLRQRLDFYAQQIRDRRVQEQQLSPEQSLERVQDIAEALSRELSQLQPLVDDERELDQAMMLLDRALAKAKARNDMRMELAAQAKLEQALAQEQLARAQQEMADQQSQQAVLDEQRRVLEEANAAQMRAAMAEREAQLAAMAEQVDQAQAQAQQRLAEQLQFWEAYRAQAESERADQSERSQVLADELLTRMDELDAKMDDVRARLEVIMKRLDDER